MEQQHDILKNSFKPWKIWLAVGLGLLIAAFMLFSGVRQVQFVEVVEGTGDYAWHDANHNGKIDIHNQHDFIAVPKGNYSKQRASDALKQLDWTNVSFAWILLAMVFMVGRDLFYMIRIRVLTHKKLGWKSSFNVILLWEFASALSPGVVGGAAVAMFILNREKIPLGRSTAIVFITTMMDNLFYVLMIPFVFLFIDSATLFPENTSYSLGIQWVFWIGFSIILIACVFLFCAVFVLPSWSAWLLNTLFKLPFLKRWKEGASRTADDLVVSSKELRKEPFSFWAGAFFSTFGSWICRYLVINALLQAFLHLGLLDHILILGKQLVLWIFMLISPTPGGSGVAEYAFGELLMPFGLSATMLAGLAVLWRLISYFPYLFIGAILLPRWVKRTGQSGLK
jgi:uncharacterized protein (TIRG00374 family)